MVTYPKGRNNLTSDLEEDDHVESDCDEVSWGVSDNFPKDKKEETRAVLSIGSFSACVHALLLPFSREK